MPFKIGDRVAVTGKYPFDRDYPFAHGADTDLWTLTGVVVASEYGYTDDKYIFVMPIDSAYWPRKEHFDPLPYWHFLPEELRKV